MDTSVERLSLPVVPKKQRRSVAEKRRIVEETLAAGASVARVARAHNVNANQVFHWRKLYQAGRLGSTPGAIKLLPVTVDTASSASLAMGIEASSQPTPHTCGDDTHQAGSGADSRGRQRRPGVAADGAGVIARMIPAGTRIWIVAGMTDLRRGFVGLSAMVQTALQENPFSGQVFVFRGRRGDLIKLLWFDGDGLCLFAKRLERGRFVWPKAESGTVLLTHAQLSMLLEGIDWRRPQRSWQPEASV